MNDDVTRRDGIDVHSGRVRAEWIDVNEHMNVAYYVLAFDLGVDALWAQFGITDDYLREQRGSTFAVDCRVGYERELTLGEPYVITAQILAYDEKRVHQFQRMYHAEHGFLAATCEWLNLHVDLDARRVTPWPKAVLDAISTFAAGQGGQQQPPEVGKQIRVGRPSWSIEGYGA